MERRIHQIFFSPIRPAKGRIFRLPEIRKRCGQEPHQTAHAGSVPSKPPSPGKSLHVDAGAAECAEGRVPGPGSVIQPLHCACKAFPMMFQRGILALLIFYKKRVSPFLPKACRFFPTCSEYAIQSIEKHGIVVGLRLMFLRVMKCHPFHSGGFDPVP